MKKFLWIVIILALTFAFISCPADDKAGDKKCEYEDCDCDPCEGEGCECKKPDDSGKTPVVLIVKDIGAFNLPADTVSATQNGWQRGSSNFSKEIFAASKYLVIKTVVPAEDVLDNKNGFGGINFNYNSDLVSGGFQKTELIKSFKSIQRIEGETIYIVIQLDKMNTYRDFTSSKYLQIIIQYYGKIGGTGGEDNQSITTLGIERAYLVNEALVKPSEAVDLDSADYGYIAKDLEL